MRGRPLTSIALVATIIVVAVAACGSGPDRVPVASPTVAKPSSSPGSALPLQTRSPVPTLASTPAPTPTPRPAPGHEVYGFVPYWEMDAGIAAHLRKTALTTLAVFSVTTTTSGAIDTNTSGYQRITGSLGKQLIREAHERGVRAELVFTSFGYAENEQFFADLRRQDRTITSLVALAGKLGMDGIAVDVELLDLDLAPAYGTFVGRLHDAVVAADDSDRVTVATTWGVTGSAMAAAAGQGADRVFLMGYDYHWADSEPGAEAPLQRRDDSGGDLGRSLDLYEALGVPVERTLLGLPLYGITWPVAGPEVGAPRTGNGEPWILRHNLDVLRNRSIHPVRDDIEVVEVYDFASDGSTPPPSPSPGASNEPATSPNGQTWQVIYVDSPATLATKLALANERGLAGAGFWAIGYERGLPAYTKLITRFAAGKAMK